MLLPIYLVSRNGVQNTGGVERVVSLLQNDLAQHGAVVTLVDETLVLPQFLRAKRLTQFIFPVAASLWLWIKRLCGNGFLTISNSSYTPFFPADVVIVHGSAAGYIRALAASGSRFLGMRLLARLEAMTMRRARRVACVSEAVRDLCVDLQGIPANKCVIIHNGIDASVFHARPKFADGVVRLGFAGRLEYGKGLPYLIDIARWVGGQADMQLVIATMSDIPPELRDLPNVTIVPGLAPDRMSAFYDNIDVFVFPSLFEGFELVTLEALASGVSVLGTRVGACDVFLRRNVPWVGELPTDSATFFGQASAIFARLRAQNDPLAMHAFIADSFSTQRFCAQIRALLNATHL
ncbi:MULTISPECIES: glycosyltransferase family 4 protein [Cupriavidus]|jgi:glycosyltransferase involved in cell wall biosynthesis|uniref:Glycosyltransferase family 4 protein n=1 Tax=Cupriavidus campinensis TaxID=151783 RepID=A0ABY3EN80_9BURK|nr:MULTISPECIES: glycosyltransferase family 4 protein [Cupriavidus]TSP12419.1 glycosyltransferase family 4 protein [Cupriavidus campinensis]